MKKLVGSVEIQLNDQHYFLKRSLYLGDGKLVLSPEGAKQLMEELEQYLVRV